MATSGAYFFYSLFARYGIGRLPVNTIGDILPTRSGARVSRVANVARLGRVAKVTRIGRVPMVKLIAQ